MVVVDLEGALSKAASPSSDTATHLVLYRSFAAIGGITHTHSRHATMFAQARREIPCLGTTHADHFFGPVPLTRPLTAAEVEADYEGQTGRVIVERFAELDPRAMPAVLVAGHAPFTWGRAPPNRFRTPSHSRPSPRWCWEPVDRPEAPPLESYVWKNTISASTGPTPITASPKISRADSTRTLRRAKEVPTHVIAHRWKPGSSRAANTSTANCPAAGRTE